MVGIAKPVVVVAAIVLSSLCSSAAGTVYSDDERTVSHERTICIVECCFRERGDMDHTGFNSIGWMIAWGARLVLPEKFPRERNVRRPAIGPKWSDRSTDGSEAGHSVGFRNRLAQNDEMICKGRQEKFGLLDGMRPET